MPDPIFDPNRAVAVEEPVFDPNRAVNIPQEDQTVFLEERGQVFGAPPDYDSRELEYSVAIDVDKRDKRDFFGMLDYGSELVKNFGKGFAVFAASTPQTVGAILKEVGEVTEEQRRREDAEAQLSRKLILDPGELAGFLTRRAAEGLKISDRLKESGQKLIDLNKEFITQNQLTPSEDEGPQKVSFDLGSAVGSISASVGLSFLTRRPDLVAPFFGLIQKSQVYEESRAAGKTPGESSTASTTAGILEGTLEYVGLHLFFEAVKVSKPVARIAVRALSEGTQEASQQAAEETVMGLSGVRHDSKELIAKRIAYSGMLGLIGGLPMAAVVTIAEKQGVKADLKAAGVADEKIDKIIINTVEAQIKAGLDDEAANILDKEVSQVNMTKQERAKLFTEMQSQLQGIEPLPAEEGGDILEQEFVPFEPSGRPTFEQKAKEIMGQEVTREQVIESLADKKESARLTQLDEEVQLTSDIMTTLEKQRERLSKAGKSVVALDKQLKRLSDEFETLDKERATLITKAGEKFFMEQDKLNLRGKDLTDVVLKQKLAGYKQGLKTGRKLTQEEANATREELKEFIKGTELEKSEAEKILTLKSIEAIKTPQQLERKLGDIEARVNDVVSRRQAKQFKEKIKALLAGTKVRTEAGRPIGKYTPEIQAVLDRVRAISEMTQEEAREKLEVITQAEGDELPSDEMRLEKYLLDTMAGLNKKKPEKLREILDELESLVATGRAGSMLREMTRKDRQATDLFKGHQVLLGGKPLDEVQQETFQKKLWKNITTLGTGWWSDWNIVLDQLSMSDKESKQEESFLSERFGVVNISIRELKSIQNLIKDVGEQGQQVYGLKSELEFARKMHADLTEEHTAVFKFSDGVMRRLTMNRQQLRKRWMEAQDPTLLEPLMSEQGNAYTTDILKWIESHLTEEDKNFATQQLEFYRNYYVLVNDIYRRQYGVNLPFNEFYSPIRRDVDKDIAENPLKQEVDAYAAFIPGSFKGRVRNFRPLRDLNDWEVLQRHVIQMEHFRHWADMIRDMNSFFSDGQTRKIIEKQFGPKMNRVIDRSIRDFKNRGMRMAEAGDKYFNLMRSSKVLFELGGKPVHLVKQITGLFSFAEFVTPAEFVDGLKDLTLNPKQVIDVLGKSDMVQLRRGDILQEFVGLMSSEDAKAFRNNPNIKLAIRLWMAPIREGDTASILIGGWPVYRKVLKETGSAEKAMEAFEKAVSRVQPTSFVGGLTEWQRGNSFQRLFTMFTSAQHRYFMREVTALRNLMAGRATPKQVAKVLAIHHILIPTLFTWISNGFNWDDEDQIKAAITGPLNGALLLGDFVDRVIKQMLIEFAEFDLDQYDSRMPLEDVVNGVGEAFSEITWDDINMEDVLEALKILSVKSVGPVTGLPTKLILKVYPEAINDINEGEAGKGLLKLGGWSPYQVDKIYDERE